MLSVITLSVIILNVTNNSLMLSVVILIAVIVNIVMLNVANNPHRLSVVMFNVVMLRVVAPAQYDRSIHKTLHNSWNSN